MPTRDEVFKAAAPLFRQLAEQHRAYLAALAAEERKADRERRAVAS